MSLLKNENQPCFFCRKEKKFKDLKRCSRCKGPVYCDVECQTKDWPAHKSKCLNSNVWYDGYRACQDGSIHEGELELITWDYYEPEFDSHLGFGGVFKDEADDLKHRFEVEMNGNLKKFYKYRPNAFRWRCCGMAGDNKYGCDHHGNGIKPCSCDFCRMGKPLTEKIYNKKTQTRHGLNLPRGPDPRSYHPGLAANAMIGRSMFGMDE